MSRTLAQALASIGESISMITNIKGNIKNAIEARGVAVPENALFEDYPALIAEIKNGGGLGGLNLPARYLFASGNRRVTIRAGTILPLKYADDTKYFIAPEDTEINITDVLDADTLQAGTDYYFYLVPDENNASGLNIIVSPEKVAPEGYNSNEIFQFGGFHSLCENVGTGLTYVEGNVTKNHPLNGYITGDILPESVWCLNHRPHSEPEGMVYISSLDFWCDIYLQSGSGTQTKSSFRGAITRLRQYVDHVEDMFCVKKELLDDGEFAAAMLGSNEQTSVLGVSESGATAGGAGGRKDTVNRRMISVYGVEEGCGSLWQWLRTTSAAGVDGAIYGQTATTPTYGWISMTTGAYGPYGQSGGKGSFYGICGALLAGGNWSNAASCGSRSRVANNARSHANSYCGGRGRSRCIRAIESL